MRNKTSGPRHLSLDRTLEEAAANVSNGEYGQALLLLEKAVRLAPLNARVRCLLAESQAKTGNLNAAVANLEKAVEAAPKNAGYRSSLAHALMPEKPSAAVPHFLAAVELGSTSPEVFCNLASTLLDLRREEEALKICDLGLKACPEEFGILTNRAVALQLLGRFDEALACCCRQHELQPGLRRVWSNMGNIFMGLGRLAESEEAHRQACLCDPQSGDAHYSLALTLLLGGQHREGFREYEWRWQSKAMKDRRQNFAQPLWDGRFLGEKRILLHAEQGAGDTIQFARYLPLVAALGGRIALEVPHSLVRLMSCLPGRHCVLPTGSPIGDFEVCCPLLTLPLLCGTDLDSIPPPASYLIPADIQANWASRVVSDKPKVALVWAGNPGHVNNRNRSLPLRSLLPLMSLGDVEFFSFQVGPPAQELKSEGLTDQARDLAPFLTDYIETAAALSHMDLVISADTSVAHLAGSLGKPVWMFLPFIPDWRWLLGRNDSPWYPTMRLFRQQTSGDWETVVHEVLSELRDWLPKSAESSASALIAPRTDLARWSDARNLKPSWNARAKLAADFIPAGATVLDLGCGAMALETFLPYNCRYLPCDLVKRDERTILCNFNEESLPAKAEATHLAALGVLEYIHDWRGFIRQLCAFQLPIVFSYHPTDYTQGMDRKGLGWVNDIRLDDLCSEVYGADFLVKNSMRVDNQVLLRIQPGQRRPLGNPRVLVLTYNNCGNFGDRLGFHLINSLLPALAEVHHANFKPWKLPPGEFDLVVVGAGNSIFEPILTEELLYAGQEDSPIGRHFRHPVSGGNQPAQTCTIARQFCGVVCQVRRRYPSLWESACERDPSGRLAHRRVSDDALDAQRDITGREGDLERSAVRPHYPADPAVP